MFSLDTKGREPLYVQLEKEIVKYINLGVYQANDPLPSVRSLACELGINPNTVAKTYKNLEANGVIYTQAGKGVFVCDGNSLSEVHKIAYDGLKSAMADAKNAGMCNAGIMEIVDEIWRDEK